MSIVGSHSQLLTEKGLVITYFLRQAFSVRLVMQDIFNFLKRLFQHSDTCNSVKYSTTSYDVIRGEVNHQRQ